MKIKDLPKEELEQLKKLFKKEVGADLLDCWGNSSLIDMANVFGFEEARMIEFRPETTKYLKILKKRHK